MVKLQFVCQRLYKSIAKVKGTEKDFEPMGKASLVSVGKRKDKKFGSMSSD